MGSPISATIANLVLEHVEEVALTTAPNPPRWWFRFVDDSHACLKHEYVEQFHKHLNPLTNKSNSLLRWKKITSYHFWTR